MTASNSGTAPRACIHRSAFYHDFTGSLLARSTSCSDSGTIRCCFCSYCSSADPYFFYTFPTEAPMAAPIEEEFVIFAITVPPWM